MQQPDPLLDAGVRSARYWNVDGLSEIAVGLQVLLVPAFLYGVARTSRGSAGRVFVVLAFALGLPAAMFLSRRVVIAIRRRTTYPRTGFVTYRHERAPWAFGVALALALLALLLALRWSSPNWVTYLFLLQGLVPGALTIYFGRIVRVIRFQVIGALCAIAGVAVALAEPGLTQGMALFWSGVGAIYLISGAITFRRYVRLYPIAAEAR